MICNDLKQAFKKHLLNPVEKQKRKVLSSFPFHYFFTHTGTSYQLALAAMYTRASRRKYRPFNHKPCSNFETLLLRF